MKRVLDLMIEFNGTQYNLLQHFTNHYLRLDTFDFWLHTTLIHYPRFSSLCPAGLRFSLYSFGWDLTENIPRQWTSTIVAYCCRYYLTTACFQESVSTGSYLSSRCLALDICFTVFFMNQRFSAITVSLLKLYLKVFWLHKSLVRNIVQDFVVLLLPFYFKQCGYILQNGCLLWKNPHSCLTFS
jgi:hypothetical protein